MSNKTFNASFCFIHKIQNPPSSFLGEFYLHVQLRVFRVGVECLLCRSECRIVYKICTPAGYSCSIQITIGSCCLNEAAAELTWCVLVSGQGVKVSVG